MAELEVVSKKAESGCANCDSDVELEAENTPVPALKLKQLKDFIRQKAKEKKLSAETLNKLKAALE